MNLCIITGKILPFFLVPVLLFACSEDQTNPVAGYGDSLTGAYKRGQQAGEAANLDAVKKTVEMYRAAHGSYPQSLDEIEEIMSSPVDLARYEYDPDTGSVSLKK
ncbi:MAG: hypothetical protein ACOYVJ_05380 [Nitrospirota bacterium]